MLSHPLARVSRLAYDSSTTGYGENVTAKRRVIFPSATIFVGRAPRVLEKNWLRGKFVLVEGVSPNHLIILNTVYGSPVQYKIVSLRNVRATLNPYISEKLHPL